MFNRGFLALASMTALAGSVAAADLGRKAPAPAAPAASTACRESAGLPSDAFGFTAGTDVADLNSWGGGLEYSGSYGTRFGSLQAHGLKAQVSTSPVRCLEIGPSLTYNWGQTSERIGLTSARSTAVGGGLEFKYKLFGRGENGFGLTFVTEPTLAHGRSRFSDPLTPAYTRGDGAIAGNTAKILLDVELVKDKLYGAFNIEHVASFTRDGVNGCTTAGGNGYCKGSNLNLRAALSLKVADGLFLGVDAAHQRAYTGTFLNTNPGHAWFAGPNIFWQVNEKVSLNAAWSTQLAGKANGQIAGQKLNLDDFSRHIAKVKLGVAF